MVSHNEWIHQLLIPINNTSTTSRTSSSTTWSGSYRRHMLFQIHRIAHETTDVANVWPALVNATRKTAPLRKIGPPAPSPPPPHLGTTTCRRNTRATLCSPGSSRTTRLIRNVIMKFLNSLRHVNSTLGSLLGLYKCRTCHCKCVCFLF
jgi:hypothetical protein